MKYAIRYEYLGTVNDIPVGYVYAQRFPLAGENAWSYTKDFNKATHFDSTEEAEREASNHQWRNVGVEGRE